jgi:hypothetical protein
MTEIRTRINVPEICFLSINQLASCLSAQIKATGGNGDVGHMSTGVKISKTRCTLYANLYNFSYILKY